MEQALRQRPSLHCSQTNDSTFFQRHMHLEIQTWKTAIIFWSVGLQRSKMIATLARVLFTRHFTVGFFFYLYVFVKIKEIFSCTPSCSHFFAALKKKGNTRNVSKLREAQREDMSTQSQSLWLTAVSVSSCRGEPGRKSHSCRTWLSSAGHSTQQHLHVLGVCGGRWPWPAAWTLVFITHREGCGWREIGLKCCSVTVTAKTQPTVKPTIVTLTSSKWTKKCHAVKVIFVSLHYGFPRCIYTEK